MSYLLRPDLNQVRLEVDSFLGRAVALGGQYGKLPERFLDTLMAFLRVRGLAQAQRRRTGIRLAKEELAKGIRQSLVCVGLALEEASGGDLNTAVEILARGQFEALRQRGWELAFGQLVEMRREASWIVRQKEVAFLGEFAAQLHAWARIVPETWTGVDPAGEKVEVDPQADGAALRQVRLRLDFLRSLPGNAVDALLEYEPGGGHFARLLRRLILAVALERESLLVDEEQVRRFQEAVFAAGRMRPEVGERISAQVGAHLERVLVGERGRDLVMAGLKKELERLETHGEEELREWFLLSAEAGEEEIEAILRKAAADEAAREAASRDIGEVWDFEDLGEKNG